jgi:hypothetical protein
MDPTNGRSRPRPIPDTLDLADRARLGINGLLGSLDADAEYDPYFLAFFLADPPYMTHYSSQYSGVLPKYVEALPLLRLTSGSAQGRDVEQKLLDAILRNIAHDGLVYDQERPDRPWNSGVGYGVRSWREDYANLAGNGRLMVGFDYYHALTGDAIWLERMARTAQRLSELAIRKDDYAYYPNVGLGNDFSYPKHSGWVHTDEPGHGMEGSEGATLFYQTQPIRGLVRWYRHSGDERALDVAGRLKRFALEPRFWGGFNDIEPAIGAARGHFWGHFHCTVAALRAILEYALQANDTAAKEFVRDAYEYARHRGVPRLGLFPGNYPETEGCTIADMVALGVQLSDAGVGDYWDDVDHYVRNALVECQATDRTELERMVSVSPKRPRDAPWGAVSDWRFERGLQRQVLPGQETTDDVIERALGGFSHLYGAYHQFPFLMSCCTANGNQALYYAWEAIVRYGDDEAQVNLLLNRRSPWLDVESSLPHAGTVVLRNKTARRISVRIPSWVDRRALRSTLDDVAVRPAWIANRVVFDGLKPGQEIVLAFPLAMETATLVFSGLNGRGGRKGLERWTCHFRGSTLVKIDDPAPDPSGRRLDWYRLFRRAHFLTDVAPTREADGYVAPKVIAW